MSAEAELPLDAEAVPLERWADGSIRLRGSRTPFYLFVESVDRGLTPDQLAEQYDLMSLADVYSLLAYRHRHPVSIMKYLAEVNARAAAVRAKFEALRGPQPTKAELLARLAKKEKAG